MIQPLLKRWRDLYQRRRAMLLIHVAKTLFENKEPARYLMHVCRTLQNVESLDISILEASEVYVVSASKAEQFTEELNSILSCISQDGSARKVAHLGFFKPMRGDTFITTRKGEAMLSSARGHLMFHLVAIEALAEFLQQDPTNSEKEYARHNQRMLEHNVEGLISYVTSLAKLMR